jgi:hypothetical protein
MYGESCSARFLKKIMEKKLKIKKTKFNKVIVNVKKKKCMGCRVLRFSVCGSTAVFQLCRSCFVLAACAAHDVKKDMARS